MWTYSKAERVMLEMLYWMGASFLFVYLTVMVLVPVLASFRLV